MATLVVSGILFSGVSLFLLARFARRPAAHEPLDAPVQAIEAAAEVPVSGEPTGVAVTA